MIIYNIIEHANSTSPDDCFTWNTCKIPSLPLLFVSNAPSSLLFHCLNLFHFMWHTYCWVGSCPSTSQYLRRTEFHVLTAKEKSLHKHWRHRCASDVPRNHHRFCDWVCRSTGMLWSLNVQDMLVPLCVCFESSVRADLVAKLGRTSCHYL